MKLLDGQIVAQKILNDLKDKSYAASQFKIKPTVAFILVGDDTPSHTYVNRKKMVAESIGFKSEVFHFVENTTIDVILNLLAKLNEDIHIHGILIQSPLPPHLDILRLVNLIKPEKDVDGFSALNLGKLAQGDVSGFIPCTPLGISKLLDYYDIHLNGAHVVIIGRSMIVGRPAALLFLEKTWNATVTICHSGTQNLSSIAQQADVLIVATGKPEWINNQYVTEKTVVIDVGINRIQDAQNSKGYRLTGDVAFDEVKNYVKAITPVPGGMGPLTVASLMYNTYKAYLNLKL